MKKINPKNPEELSKAIGKECKVLFDVIGFPNEEYYGKLINIKFNTVTGELSVDIKIDDAGISIPVKHIQSLEIEEGN